MPETAPRKILIVDDDPAMRSLAKRLLSAEGYTVELTESGDEGLAKLKASADWHALVTDKDMPRMNGFEVAEAAHRIRPALPIVMFTAHGQRLPKGAAIHLDAYLPKPFKAPGDLAKAVAEAVETRKRKVEQEQLQRKIQEMLPAAKG